MRYWIQEALKQDFNLDTFGAMLAQLIIRYMDHCHKADCQKADQHKADFIRPTNKMRTDGEEVFTE